jgi:Flp pilus assembly protein TadD
MSYLKAKEKFVDAKITANGDPEQSLRDVLNLLQQAVKLDPNFAAAYCLMAFAHDALYLEFDPTPDRRALADEAINKALRSQPDLPEVHLAHANHLYRAHRDYERARAELAIAKRQMPNKAEVIYLEAAMDRRQGNFEKAIQHFEEAIKLDPRNPLAFYELAETLSYTRQFPAAERVWDQLIDLVPDQPMARVQKEAVNTIQRTADDTAYRTALGSLPTSLADDSQTLSCRLNVAIDHRDWPEAKVLLEKMRDGEDAAQFAFGARPVPVGCYSILLARLQGEEATDADPAFTNTRRRLSQKVEAAPENAPAYPLLLSNLAVVDALLGRKEDALSEAKRAVEMVPISKDAIHGVRVTMNLAVVYAWTEGPDQAFQLLEKLATTPYGLFLNDLKLSHYFDPLRNDPRYERLQQELARHA